MAIKACVFDAYGTLFDVSAAAREAAGEPGQEALAGCWQALSETWRQKQLGYSWLRAVTGAHADFWQVTGEALDYALAEQKLADPALRERLLALYFELSAYPEVPEMLGNLKETGFATAILSNGSPEMLLGAVTSAGIGEVLDEVISVEDVSVFKPDRRVYDLVGTALDVAPAEVLFVSSNGWDAAAASGYGFVTAWVNRTGLPMDRLPWRPAHELSDLTTIPELAGRL
ncbi:haloacid dehalogenase type II [Oceanicola sp. 502str15]|uniref:haloacid dehalogenase type II n=1 Tax=Oceanicola sp. 502str15 TaxID=2696061 RepID=UPI002095BB70|nr:haloacid dehalogenase type II [Oceanicola sp. 502str15]MCO6383516.1 haloacid dehalogenase type II [Oceanicola sp. 502str15]